MAGAPFKEVSRKSETWGSRFGFIMAAVGSSVGLGNFWRFPYTAGENGGGAFILVYLLCVAFIGLPILMAEYAMGRKSGHSAIEGVQTLAAEAKRSRYWGIVGWVGTMTSFFILTFYMVISVWLLTFVFQAVTGAFTSITPEASETNFGATISNTWSMIGLLFLYILANAIVVGRGVKGGLERAATFLMPLFFFMLIGVVIFAAVTGDFLGTAEFLFAVDWDKISFSTFLQALGQSFFSIGVGVGLMMTYGAYLSKDTNIPKSAGIVAGADTLVALIAGFAIFPIVFATGGNAAAGPGLFFITMPVAFGSIPGGEIIATVFFALALFAAFTSSISLLEVSVSWLEERHGVTRMGASLGLGFVLFMVGAAYVFSTAYLDFVDFVTGSILLPLGGLLVAVFVGWILPKNMLESEFADNKEVMSFVVSILRWAVPIFVGVILVFGFLDNLQNLYGVELPGFLVPLLGDNN